MTLPYGGIKMAGAVLGAVARGMGFIFTSGDKTTADKIWGTASAWTAQQPSQWPASPDV